MPRPRRQHYPGTLYHVMLRGNNRREVFWDDSDRRRFCALLAQGVERFGHRIHAFCLMANHVHLALQVEDTPLSQIMQNLAGRYTQWCNWRHERVGHLFQGRYKALLVEAESYLFTLVAYIHRNPVEAGIVGHARDYTWSSHPAYLGRIALPWLTTDWLLGQLAADPGTARLELEALVERSMPVDLSAAVRAGQVLGSEAFAARVLQSAPTANSGAVAPERLLAAVAEAYRLSPDALALPGKAQPAAEARAVLAWLVRRNPAVSLEWAASRLGRAPASLSAAASRLEQRLARDPALAQRVEAIRQHL